MLKIYVDLRCLQDSNYKGRGVGRHTLGVVKYARKYLPKDAVIIGIVNQNRLDSLDSNIHQYFDKLIFSFGEAANEADIFLNTFPFGQEQKSVIGVLSKKKVITATLFYDLIPYLNKQKYLSSPSIRIEYLNDLNLLRLYDLIFSISKASEVDLRRVIDLENSKLFVTGACVSNDYFMHKSDVNNFMQNNYKNPYFIMVGGGDDRKNMNLALEEYKIVLDKNKVNVDFILVGHYSQKQIQEYKKYATDNNFLERLHIITSPTNSELANLYQSAVANICPSSAEGFFIPLVEGLASSCLPITSDCPAQCEIIDNDKRIIFELGHPGNLSELMLKALSDIEWKNNILKLYKNKAKLYKEAEVSRKVWNNILDQLKIS